MQASSASPFQFDFGKPATAEETLRRLDALARLLDSAVQIPGTGIRVGADFLMGLVPVVGNLAASAVSAYLLFEARRFNLPKTAMLRMMGNIAMDTVIGAVPMAGNVADVFWRANTRNMRILREHLSRHPSAGRGRVIEGTATRLD